ncbi:hypothetical protein [Epibacterium sp. Ofav1-8]|uniref:hypothetical protein n=1 Tax=Epibacterium sp. Ofav1-8 TaxID=2917735 RepID=UPI001EF6E403|nr:hypothetical protein [Epibacterium sp. Ofav1-8]MCG7624874.1 hypothetical protein [Epibacterium sp. Ofav1-8]
MNTVYKFTNEHIGLEIRRSGDGLHGFWIVQISDENTEGSGKRTVTQWYPSPETAVDCINCGHSYRYWDGAKLNALGVPSKLCDWRTFENDRGALDA